MLMKWIGKLLVVVMAMGILAQLILIPLAEKALAKAAARLPAGSVEVRIDTFPPWKLLQGKIDQLHLKATDIQLNELTLAELQGSFSQVELSWWASWYEGAFDYSFREPGEITVIMTEEDLTQYLSRQLTVPLHDLRVSINGNRIQLGATLAVAGQELPLLITGNLALEQPDKIKLNPEKIQLGSFVPGSGLQEKLIGNTTFRLPLEKLPVKVEFHRLAGGPRKLTLQGLVWTQEHRPPVSMSY